MRFAKYLELEAVPEWRQKYINYKGLKKLIAQLNDEKDEEVLLDRFQRPILPNQNSPPQLSIPQIEVVCSADDITELHPTSEAGRGGSLREAFGGFWNQHINWLNTTQAANLTPIEADVTLQQMLTCCSQKEQEFFVNLDGEVAKICLFYEDQLKNAANRYKALVQQVKLHQRHRLRSVTATSTLGLPLLRTITDKAHSLNKKSKGFWEKLISTPSSTPRDSFYQPRSRSYSVTTLDDDRHPDTDYEDTHRDNDEEDDEDNFGEKNREDQLFAEVQVSSNIAKKKLKAAIKEFYRGLLLLENFKTLNRIGIGLILDRFDDAAKWQASTLYNIKIANTALFATDSLEEIKKATESLFVHGFSEEDKKKGIEELRLPGSSTGLQGSFGRFGLYVGLAIPVLVQGIIEAQKEVESYPEAYILLQIMGAMFLPLLLAMLFSLNAYIWQRNRVNYKFVFELNPRDNLEIHQFMEIPGFLFLIFSYCFYLAFNTSFIYPEWYPLIFLLVLVTLLLLPINVFYLSARRWFTTLLVRIVTSGLRNVHYRDFYLAEQLTSLTYALGNVALMICAYENRFTSLDKTCSFYGFWLTHFFIVLPYYWRLAQSVHRYLRTKANYQFGNCIKFSLGSARYISAGVYYVNGSKIAFVIWLIFASLHTMYATTWDLVIDWGLFKKGASFPLLRKNLLYKPWCYYVGMIFNVAIRLSWISMAKPYFYHDSISKELLLFILALLEVFRRFVWNIFRMENDHVSNCESYRVTKDIPLPYDRDVIERGLEVGLMSTHSQTNY